jgi:hypothetical protein
MTSPTYAQNKKHIYNYEKNNRVNRSKYQLAKYYWKKEKLIYLAILIDEIKNEMKIDK